MEFRFSINSDEFILVLFFLVDAVYAMAHAVHNFINDECVDEHGTVHYLCDSLKPAPPGQRLLQYIRNVTFTGTYKIIISNNLFLNLFFIYILPSFFKMHSNKHAFVIYLCIVF